MEMPEHTLDNSCLHRSNPRWANICDKPSHHSRDDTSFYCITESNGAGDGHLCKDCVPQLVAKGGRRACCAITQEHSCGQQLHHGHVGEHVPGGVRCESIYGVLKQERHLRCQSSRIPSDPRVQARVRLLQIAPLTFARMT